MDATLFRIAGRHEAFPAEVRRVGQYDLTDPSKGAADIVIGESWSLYCLDIPGNRALFVELPADADLAGAPFVYGAQFSGAIRAATVPLEALPELAAETKPPANLSLILSTGRCGSTLVSRIFARIPGVWSLSEPDWFTNIAFSRFDLDPGTRDALIAACTRLTCRPRTGSVTEAIVLKPRSEMMSQCSAYIDVLKGANAVFLYRDCFGYVNSLYRFSQRVQGIKDPPPGSPAWEFARQLSTINAPKSFLRRYFPEDEQVEILDLMTLAWAIRMGAFLEARSGGMNVTPMHYEDMSSDQTTQTAILLESCGIEPEHLEVAAGAFGKDAHSGSAGENLVPSVPISEAQRDRIASLVSRWGLSDYVKERLPQLTRGS